MYNECDVNEAKSFYAELTEEGNLCGLDVKREMYQVILEKFVNSDLNKKDITVLVHMMDKYLDWETAIFKLQYSQLDDIAPRSNISRTMKKLNLCGFIEKTHESTPKVQYFFFTIQYETMKSWIGNQ